jgi:hypothetical protein
MWSESKGSESKETGALSVSAPVPLFPPLTMTGALGVKAPTDYSVWTAAAGAFLLGVVVLREQGGDGIRKFDADASKPEQYSRARGHIA